MQTEILKHSTFIGRKAELRLLEEQFELKKSRLIVVYGRRRVGKSALIKKFGEGKNIFYFEGLEQQRTLAQISYFVEQLKKQSTDRLIESLNLKKWEHVFNYITDKIILVNKRPIICIDELPWLAVGRSSLISLIKSYWDKYWKDSGVILILCGSLTSFMVKRVVKSKALYGRINFEINLKGLLPNEAKLSFKNKINNEEIVKYLLVFGGIPKYLEEINLSRSFEENIERICFDKTSPMIEEIQKIFYSQFKEYKTYSRIVESLMKGPKGIEEITRDLKESSGGGFKEYCTNLELSDFIKERKSLLLSSKYKVYEVSDEFLNFSKKYILPNLDIIKESTTRQNLFNRFCRDTFDIWLGVQFEKFCRKYAIHFAKIAGFEDKVTKVGTIYKLTENGYQFDIAYERNDNTMVLGEIKFLQSKIPAKVAKEFEERVQKLELKNRWNVKKMLISLNGPSEELRDFGYFDYFIKAEELFE